MYYNPASLDRAHRALLAEAKPAAMEKTLSSLTSFPNVILFISLKCRQWISSHP